MQKPAQIRNIGGNANYLKTYCGRIKLAGTIIHEKAPGYVEAQPRYSDGEDPETSSYFEFSTSYPTLSTELSWLRCSCASSFASASLPPTSCPSDRLQGRHSLPQQNSCSLGVATQISKSPKTSKKAEPSHAQWWRAIICKQLKSVFNWKYVQLWIQCWFHLLLVRF